MEISRLYLGSIGGPLSSATPFNGYLLKHPSGAVLIDTGFGTTMGNSDGPAGEMVYGELRMPWVRRTTVEALADHGAEPGDIKYVINTHLNDHGGDNHMFPEATFIVQRPEWEWLADSPNKEAWDLPGVKVELLGAEDAEVLPGVTCLFTPGHTPGHQSIVVEQDGEKTLFLGDAAYTIDIWDDPEQIAEGHPALQMQVQVPDGREMWLESVAKLKAIDADTIHFAHDPRICHPHGAHRH
jgi:glyoxylase-like metal-dependent hydrolase (beta-lactamase superfamily II)